MNVLESEKVEAWGGVAMVSVAPDEHMDDPRKTGEMEGAVEVFRSREAFRERMEAIFGESGAQAAVDELVAGKVVWVRDRPYVGIEKYAHGRVAYGPCRGGNFPDRQRDVSPIVGVWSPENRLSARRGTLADARRARREGRGEQLLLGVMRADLATFGAWTNGDGLAVRVKGRTGRGARFMDGPFGGFVDQESAMSYGKSVVEGWLKAGAAAGSPP